MSGLCVDRVSINLGRRGISTPFAIFLIAALGIGGILAYLNLPASEENAPALPAQPAGAVPNTSALGDPSTVPIPAKITQAEGSTAGKAQPPASASGNVLHARPSSDTQGNAGGLIHANSYWLPDAADYRTRVSIRKGEAAKDSRGLVALAKPTGPRTTEETLGTNQSILVRELIRQAFLIAARDELGLRTRDELLDDIPPTGSESETYEISSLIAQHALSRVIVRKLNGKGAIGDPLLRSDLASSQDPVKYLLTLIPNAEGLSRSEFPGILKTLGLRGEPNKIRGDAPVPEDVEARLNYPGFFENLSAIQDLHTAMRSDGESPARLGALARGYAQLGVLSEFHWNPAHKAFKARALLYAERLVARDPDSAEALRTRAFVRTLVGLPQAARDDLASAAKAAGGGNGMVGTAPHWLPAIEAALEPDAKKLREVVGSARPLASLLGTLAVEFPNGNSRLFPAVKAVVETTPDSYRAYDAISSDTPINVLHFATSASPTVLSRTLTAKLSEMKRLPGNVRPPLDRLKKAADVNTQRDVEGEAVFNPPAEESAVLEALATATDDVEPSWGTLAHLIRETRFVQVLRRLHFMAGPWGVPIDEFLLTARPVVERHPYRPFLDIFDPATRQGFSDFARRVDPVSLEITEYSMLQLLKKAGVPTLWMLAVGHDDAIAHDLARGSMSNDQSLGSNSARRLLEIDPRSALAMTSLVTYSWPVVKGKAAEWRQLTHDAPVLLRALASKYSQDKQYEQARSVILASLRQAPDHGLYKMLAENYKAQGDLERWRGTLKESLDAMPEALGLERAQAQVELAYDLMRQKKWPEARRYADEAAETGAAWAMICVSSCAEGMGDWDAAEDWLKQLGERYDDRWYDWYLFCKRSGHGNLTAARVWAEGAIENSHGASNATFLTISGFYYWSIGKPEQASELFELASRGTPYQITKLYRFLIADQLQDHALRDRLLDEYCTRIKHVEPAWVPLSEAMKAELTQGNKPPLEAAAWDRLVEAIPPKDRSVVDFCLGRYLLNRGQSELARRYLERCTTESSEGDWLGVIAADLVRSLKSEK